MAVLTTQTIIRTGTGLEPDYETCAAGGDSFVNTGTEFLHVKNGSGGSLTVTVTTPVTVDSLAVSDQAYAIPAGEERMIGPFPCRWYASSGSTSITYSGVTSLTIAVIKPGS